MKRLIQICVACAVLALASPAQASSVTIDFNDPGLSAGVEVGNFYQYLGVTFVDATVADPRSYYGLPYSSPNVITHSTSGPFPQPDDPIEAIFDSAASFVSLEGVGIGVAGYLLSAYDAAVGGNLLATTQVFGGGQPSGGGAFHLNTLSVSANGIRRIEFSQITRIVGDGAAWGRLTFVREPVETPEPGTLSLLSVSMVGLVMRRRRRKTVGDDGVSRSSD